MNQTVSPSLADYANAFRRRLPLFLYIAVPIVLIASGFAVGLPDIYRSTSEMQINLEGPAINTVEPLTLTTFADQYVGTLRRNVLTRENMLGWIDELGLYGNNEAEVSESDLVQKMSENIRIAMVTTGVLEPRSGKELELITGFTVSFNDRNPEIAQQVASRVADSFLREDRKIGLERTDPVLGFLDQQMSAKLSEISELESRIADFKEQNAGRLPEMMAVNMSVLDRSERELESVRSEIRSLEQDRIYRQAQLDEVLQGTSLSSQCEDLQQEYVEMLARYGSDHPDLIVKKRQFEACIGDSSVAGETAEIARLEVELATLRQRYSDEHPDVKDLVRRIRELRNEQEQTISRMRGERGEDPQVLEARAKLNAIDAKLRGLRTRQGEVRAKIEDLERKIAATPQVERQYLALERELDSARETYDGLREDYNRTLQIREAEKELGARLEQITRPWVPDEPASPPRLAIMVLGAFLALTFGGMTAIAAEGLDSTVRGSRDIQTIWHAKPIGTIPVVQNSDSRAARRRHIMLITMSLMILVGIVFSLSGLFRVLHLF